MRKRYLILFVSLTVIAAFVALLLLRKQIEFGIARSFYDEIAVTVNHSDGSSTHYLLRGDAAEEFILVVNSNTDFHKSGRYGCDISFKLLNEKGSCVYSCTILGSLDWQRPERLEIIAAAAKGTKITEQHVDSFDYDSTYPKHSRFF
jgi:hypothetical protein